MKTLFQPQFYISENFHDAQLFCSRVILLSLDRVYDHRITFQKGKIILFKTITRCVSNSSIFKKPCLAIS